MRIRAVLTLLAVLLATAACTDSKAKPEAATPTAPPAPSAPAGSVLKQVGWVAAVLPDSLADQLVLEDRISVDAVTTGTVQVQTVRTSRTIDGHPAEVTYYGNVMPAASQVVRFRSLGVTARIRAVNGATAEKIFDALTVLPMQARPEPAAGNQRVDYGAMSFEVPKTWPVRVNPCGGSTEDNVELPVPYGDVYSCPMSRPYDAALAPQSVSIHSDESKEALGRYGDAMATTRREIDGTAALLGTAQRQPGHVYEARTLALPAIGLELGFDVKPELFDAIMQTVRVYRPAPPQDASTTTFVSLGAMSVWLPANWKKVAGSCIPLPSDNQTHNKFVDYTCAYGPTPRAAQVETKPHVGAEGYNRYATIPAKITGLDVQRGHSNGGTTGIARGEVVSMPQVDLTLVIESDDLALISEILSSIEARRGVA